MSKKIAKRGGGGDTIFGNNGSGTKIIKLFAMFAFPIVIIYTIIMLLLKLK
jgi:hypothetical protein